MPGCKRKQHDFSTSKESIALFQANVDCFLLCFLRWSGDILAVLNTGNSRRIWCLLGIFRLSNAVKR